MLVQIAAGLFILIVALNFLGGVRDWFYDALGLDTVNRIVGIFQIIGCGIAIVMLFGIAHLIKGY